MSTPSDTEGRARYWHANLRVTAVLLGLWFLVTFGVSYFARELDFRFFGWPFSFWVAAQGALLVYGLIIAFYAWYMNRLDDRRAAAADGEGGP
ncbi:DUF4212 domain-containing protein [Macromonas nakdongensis]|uniref:DUF4212 domain-containing protein n=1 Tax=Macromonas nakdongensis TaxID=1843082 RepID=UPI000C32FC7C|nr:DUF4212 domain-containing protein [Macromonas nakdongensis]